jgi:uncharacterized membrane protein
VSAVASGNLVSRKGFVLIATCIILALLVAIAGLGVDIGRMCVIKSELQAFADAAALTAATQLDGSESGIARARAAAREVATGPHAMKWDMGTQPITGITSTFTNVGDRQFARVVATAPAPLIFLRAFQSFATDFSTVSASSVAVKTAQAVRLAQ